MTTNWKQQCIDTFHLLPPVMQDTSDDTSDDAVWKAYHQTRVSWNQRKDRFESFQREPELLEQWENALAEIQTQIKNKQQLNDKQQWQTSNNNSISMDIQGYVPTTFADSGIQTVEYHAMLWSPYAIPRAIQLRHKYHRKPDWNKQEFSASWSYWLVDTFEKETAKETKDGPNMIQLCSACYEDEELQADVINTDGFTIERVADLKRFLFASDSSWDDDLSFLKLLFASMATPNFRVLHDDGVNNFIGHTWKPEQGGFLRERLVEEGILDFEDDDVSTTWLEYHARRITQQLLPMDKYYKPFQLQDAPGYYAYQQKKKGLK